MLSLLPTAVLLRSTVGYPRDLWVDYTVINQGFLWMEVFIKGRPHDTVIVYTYSILLKKVVQVGPSSTKISVRQITLSTNQSLLLLSHLIDEKQQISSLLQKCLQTVEL